MRAVGMNQCMELCRELGAAWQDALEGALPVADTQMAGPRQLANILLYLETDR